VLHEPVAASILIEPEIDVVIVEGLYLLLNLEPWNHIKPILDVSVFLDVNWEQRRERLIVRQHAGGRSWGEAQLWVDGPDKTNSAVVLQNSDLEGALFVRDGLLD
jgi:pantothenate kinase